MVLVDTHSHLYDMKKGYVLPQDIFPVVVGYSYTSNRKAVECAHAGNYPLVLGIAPQTIVKEGASRLDDWVAAIREGRPNAIGEVGLDYKWARSIDDVVNEKAAFSRMVALAKELSLPLVIHSRDNPEDNGLPKNAIDDILGMLGGMRFVMHFFSGTAEQAEKVVAMGGYISVTHIRSKEKRKVINSVPLDRLFVESDSPYIGRTPETVREAAAYIAEVKGITADDAGKATAENAMKFFGFRL